MAPPGGKRGKLPPPMGGRPKIMQYVCAFIVMELLRITRQIHCKAVEQRATLIHRQYNRDWGTSYSRLPIDPYLTSHPLQNPGNATDANNVVRPLRGNFCSRKRLETFLLKLNEQQARRFVILYRTGPPQHGASLARTRARISAMLACRATGLRARRSQISDTSRRIGYDTN